MQHKQDLAAGEAWARKAVALAPQVADFHDTLGWVLRARGQLPAARAALQQAAKLAPKAGQIQYHLAVVQSEAGDKVAARASLQRALAAGDFASADDARKLEERLGDRAGNPCRGARAVLAASAGGQIIHSSHTRICASSRP